MPYTHKKVGTKFVVYKKGKKVGETEGTKTALNKYLAALHIADKKTAKKESKSLKENHEMGQELGDGHPGCEDTVGQICIVLKPTPGVSPEELVHTTHAFGMGQFDPSTVHGVYQDEKQAQQVAEAACSAMEGHLKSIEEKKMEVTGKIEETIKKLQKEVNRCMEEGKDQRAQQVIQKIAELRSKHQMVEASKKPIEEKEEK